MYAPDKIAVLILKVMVSLTLFSLLLAVANIVPYYMKMHQVTNDLILRASVNNYLLESQVESAIDEAFISNDLFKELTFPQEQSTYGNVHVYARTATTPGDLFPKVSGCNTGEYCSYYSYSNYDYSNNRAIFDRPNDWDPKTKPNDMIEFNDLNGAQRGDVMSVRIDAKVKAKILVAGGMFEFGIPLSVQKSSPAMHYYRGR